MATVILLALFAQMWIVLIVPRQRELKRHSRLLAELEVGDEVMTGAGIYGVIRAIDGEYVRLEVAEGIELRMAKRAVMAKVPAEVGRAVLDGDDDSTAAGDASTGDTRPDAA